MGLRLLAIPACLLLKGKRTMTTLQFWFSVVSVMISPLIAVQVTVWLQRNREKRERQLSVFKTLMRTRASGMAPEHVQALNMIDVEFYDGPKRPGAVVRSWKAYL